MALQEDLCYGCVCVYSMCVALCVHRVVTHIHVSLLSVCVCACVRAYFVNSEEVTPGSWPSRQSSSDQSHRQQ